MPGPSLHQVLRAELSARRYLQVAAACDARAAVEHNREARAEARSDGLEAHRAAACVRVGGLVGTILGEVMAETDTFAAWPRAST